MPLFGGWLRGRGERSSREGNYSPGGYDMVRRRFSIAGLLALGVLMIAADASQAQLLQRLRSRLGRSSDDGSTTTSGRFFSRRSYYRGEQGDQIVSSNVPSNQVALDIRVPSSAEV